MNHAEDYCYDGDADDDSFQSAICEKYDGFRLLNPSPAEPLPTENNKNMLHTKTGSLEILFTSGDGKVVLYDDEASISSAQSEISHLFNENEDDLSYISYESSLYNTDISLDDDIDEEFLMLTLWEERNIIFKKLNTSSEELQLNPTTPLNQKMNATQCYSAETSIDFNNSDSNVICNIQDLDSVSEIPHLESTNISETDQSLLSLNTFSQSYR